jgi:hypothetical protein
MGYLIGKNEELMVEHMSQCQELTRAFCFVFK